MKTAGRLVSIILFLLVLIIAGCGVGVAFAPKVFYAFASVMLFLYAVLFFSFSRFIGAAVRDELPESRRRGINSLVAGWQMLWLAGPSKGLKFKVWLVHFLPIIAFFLLIVEGVLFLVAF
jgi:hypothetical protein